MTAKEVEFRNWFKSWLEERGGSVLLPEAVNSGAYHCDCSQQTIERYLKKWAYSGEIGFVTEDKYMNGKFIHRVVLKR